MRKWVLLCVTCLALTIPIGCGIAKDVLKTVSISQRIQDVRDAETTVEQLKALGKLIEAMEEE